MEFQTEATYKAVFFFRFIKYLETNRGERSRIVAFFSHPAGVIEQGSMPLLLESSKAFKSYKLSLVRN